MRVRKLLLDNSVECSGNCRECAQIPLSCQSDTVGVTRQNVPNYSDVQ